MTESQQSFCFVFPKYNYNSYFYCAPYSVTDGALQKSANVFYSRRQTEIGRHNLVSD